MKKPYDDIIELPHHVSRVHPQMSMEERAAQFSPFAALTGYGAVIQETARLTVPRLELSESSQEEIKRKLDDLAEHLNERKKTVVTYYRPDQKKAGGAYVTASGIVRRIDHAACVLQMEDGLRIPIPDILDVNDVTDQ